MRFTVEIDSDDEALTTYPTHELSRILREIADRIEDGRTDGPVRDINGATVGTFALTTDD